LPRDGVWWFEKPGDAARLVVGHVRELEQQNESVHQRNYRNDWLYNADVTPGLGWSLKNQGYRPKDGAWPSDNVVRSTIDTARSIVARQRPRPVIQTDGAKFGVRQRAKKLSKFIEGIFRSEGVYDTGPIIFRDAGIYGTGGWKISDNGDRHDPTRILCERFHIDDIIVDEIEARTCPLPRQLAHRHFVSAEILKTAYPKHKAAIDEAASMSAGSWTTYRTVPSGMVPLVEAWHLPSGPGADDGRRIVACGDATLEFGDYDDDEYPLVFYKWREPTGGFYGRGIAEELAPIQLRLNQVNRFINLSQDHFAIPRLVVDRGALMTEKLTNRLAEIIEKRPGSDVKWLTTQAVSPEMYAYRRELMKSAFEQIGISQLSAQSLKPAGLESAVALREFNDIETQRFAIQAMRYEAAHIDLARQIIRKARDIYERVGSFKSVWTARSLIEEIDWDKVDLDDECFCISVEASSLLSRTPAGRSQTVVEWAQAGIVDRDEARELLDHPDLKSAHSMASAALENVDWKIEQVLGGKRAPPTPGLDNLELYAQRFTMAALKAEREGAPPEIIQTMLRHIEQARAAMAPPMAQGPMPQQGGNGIPDQAQAMAQQQVAAQMAAQAGGLAGVG
jgi:hypothetical protein